VIIDDIREYLKVRSNPVQLVKHLDEVPENKIQYPLIGQKKYDGLYCLVIVQGGIFDLYSRTGKAYYHEVAEAISDQFYNDMSCMLDDGVYITELCNDQVSLEVLSGLVSTNRKKDWTTEEEAIVWQSYCMFHDFLTFEEFLDGYSEQPYMVRYYELTKRLTRAERETLLVLNTPIYDRDGADKFADAIIEKGGEGAVFKQNVDWEAGHKGYRAMKIVRGLHVDLLCIGVQYGKGKRSGQIAKLEFSYKGSVFSADLGKGWTDARRSALTNAHEKSVGCTVFTGTYGHGSNAGVTEYPPVGKIWEVKALQESSTGKALRLPKVVRVREDKDTPDY
jgi:ATP-dependent DNA ligase